MREIMKTKEIILNTDPTIISYKTNIEGWVGKDGRFYGKNKETAIYANSTHKKCDKGHIYRKGWTNCPECSDAEKPSKYMQLPFKEWDRKTPLNLFETDEYFFDEEDVLQYIEDNPEAELDFVICEPNYLWEIQSDFWEDIMPEDMDLEDVASKGLLSKLNEINEIIKNHKPISWNGGDFRTTVKL